MQGPGSFGITNFIIIGGGAAISGLFLYNGVPADGNPPVIYAVPPGVTDDPFGNSLFTGSAGGLVVARYSGTTVESMIWLNPQSTQIQLAPYIPDSPTLLPGALSIISTGTQLGLALGSPTTTTGATPYPFSAEVNVIAGSAGGLVVLYPAGTGQVVVNTTGATPVSSALFEVDGTSSLRGAVVITTGGLSVTGGLTTDTLTATSTSELEGAVTITAGGLSVTGGTTTDTFHATGTATFSGSIDMPHGLVVSATSLGNLQFDSGNDSEIYYTGSRRLIGTGNPQLVNSTSFTTVAGLTTNVGPGSYIVRGQVVLEGVAASAGNPEFQFNGTCTMTSMGIEGEFGPNTGASVAINRANATALASTMVGQVLSTTADQVFTFAGIINVSAAGSFHLDAACSAAADTYDIFGTISFMILEPVG
jgi:hypothetical protein